MDMDMDTDTYRLDKTAFSVTDMNDIESDKQYWFKKTPIERLEFVEYFRILNYGENVIKSGIQRVFEVIEPK
jgi:hypothetical protein